LSEGQRETLVGYAKQFVEWLNTKKGQDNVFEHRDHEAYFKEKLRSENLAKMTADEFREVYKVLWASNMWGNKDWYIDHRLLEPNGLDKLRRELTKLLYGSDDISKRYDEFKANVKGLGPSSISEILHFVFPDKFCLWNEKPKSVLPFLGLGNLLPDWFFKYQIADGADYYSCIRILDAIKNELRDFGVADFIDLDLFFWYIYDEIMPTMKKEIEVVPPIPTISKRIKISEHEGAEFYLLELGKKLGFITYTVDQSKTFNNQRLGEIAMLKQIPAFAGDRDIGSAREIDVIWFGEDENPEFCFEVEHTMDIVRSLNRLAQLQHLHVKFFIVAPEERRSKFESEMGKYPYRRMRNRYRFISYDELASFIQAATPFYELKVKLLGEE